MANIQRQKEMLQHKYLQGAYVGENIDVSDYMNTQYFVDIQIGSDDQTFTVVPDTGSSNVWVYSADCNSLVCKQH